MGTFPLTPSPVGELAQSVRSLHPDYSVVERFPGLCLWVPASVCTKRHLTGRDPANSTALPSQTVRSCSESMPGGWTSAQPFITRPFMSAGSVWGSANVSSCLLLSSRTSKDPFHVPTHMFPLIMKQTPPNIFRSVTPFRCERIRRIRSRSASSPLATPCTCSNPTTALLGVTRTDQSDRATSQD